MKRVRPLLIGVTAIAAVLLIVFAVVLNSSFQTWLVREMLASRPELHLTVSRVDAGLHHVEVTGLVFQRNGTLLAAPRVSADLSLAAVVLHRRFSVSQLVANGWILTLPAGDTVAGNSVRTVQTAPSPAPDHATVTATSSLPAAGQAPASASEFAGVFRTIELPSDVSLDAVQLTGTVRRGASKSEVNIHGGGLGIGREATFHYTTSTTLDDPVQSIHAAGELRAGMDTARTFDRIAITLDATAEGLKLGEPVQLHVEGEVHRSGTTERYTVKLTKTGRELAVFTGEFAETTRAFTGHWKLDVHDADVSAFTLGRRIPKFVITGAGTFDSDANFQTARAVGTLDASVDQLAALSQTLTDIPSVNLKADINVARRGAVFSVSKFNATVATATAPAPNARPGAKTVATLRALQAFDFNPATGELKPTNPATDLLGIVLDSVPLVWGRPFLHDVMIDGSDLRGELTATPRAGGFTFRSKTPLAVSRLSVTIATKPLLRDVDVALGVSGDYTPVGWQAEFNGVTARSGAITVMLIDAKAGRLAGKNQPLKATGLISADLAAAALQPAFASLLTIKQGQASIEFAASIGPTKQVQATVGIKNLASARVPDQKLPDLTATVRADVAADGKVTLNAPITIQRNGRASDVTLAGSFVASGEEIAFDGQVASKSLFWDDVAPLAAALPRKSGTTAATQPPSVPWAGWTGSVAVQCGQLTYTGVLQMSNVSGKLHLDGSGIRFEDVHASVGESGTANARGTVTFDAPSPDHYSGGADVSLNDFDPAPWLMALNPNQAPTVDGRFSVTAKLTSRARTMGALARSATGDLALTSRAGVFRGLRVDVGNLVENSSKLAAWLAAAGDALTSPFLGRKDQDEITSRSQAANELAKILTNIQYDQMAVVLVHDDAGNAAIKEFTLISPDLRISGSGTATRNGGSMLNEKVGLDLRLRARGRPAELMKYLGVLDPKPDDLGYSACTIPVRVEGAFDRLDAPQLSNRLVALAVAPKTGITEKAVDWINRLRGKSTN